MNVEKIYLYKDSIHNEIIYQLKNGTTIIQRDDDKARKFNLNTWDEISFVPEGFQEIDRNITIEEEKSLNRFFLQQNKKNQKGISILERIKRKWDTFFK